MTVLAYFADLLCQAAPDSEMVIDRRWILPEERDWLLLDGRVIAATFVPLEPAFGINPVAWLVQDMQPGPYVTPSFVSALRATDLRATVTSLRFGGLDPRDT